MRSWMIVLMIAVAGSLLISNAHAQAAAETALTHGLASSAGSSLGNALGKATNQVAGRVAQTTTSSTIRHATGIKPGTLSTATSTPSPVVSNSGSASVAGPMIISIQGGEQMQNACDLGANSGVDAHSAKKTANDGASQAGTCAKTSGQASDAAHPSEITLPLAK